MRGKIVPYHSASTLPHGLDHSSPACDQSYPPSHICRFSSTVGIYFAPIKLSALIRQGSAARKGLHHSASDENRVRTLLHPPHERSGLKANLFCHGDKLRPVLD